MGNNELLGAIARGWTHPENEKKVLDADLVFAIAKEIKRSLQSKQRTWVGLTHEEIDYQAKKDDHAVYFALGALWAEAKLKEKNNGN